MIQKGSDRMFSAEKHIERGGVCFDRLSINAWQAQYEYLLSPAECTLKLLYPLLKTFKKCFFWLTKSRKVRRGSRK